MGSPEQPFTSRYRSLHPFPGDDSQVVQCARCGAPYTMREFRRFSWVQYSDLCISCEYGATLARMNMALEKMEPRPQPPDTLVVKYPPTVNNLYPTVVVAGRPRRVKSGQAVAYIADVQERARQAKVVKRDGAVAVTLYIFRPRRQGDIDGVFKVLLDALSGIAYQDDEQIDSLMAFRFEDKESPRVEVTIEDSQLST